MHHVQDCSRVLEVRRGLVVSTVLFPPTSLKYRVIKTLGLCSCGKKKKKKKTQKNTDIYYQCVSLSVVTPVKL